MRLSPAVLSVVALLTAVAHANPTQSVARRALSNSPSGGYAPAAAKCPDTLIRSARDISDGEQKFLETRKKTTDTALKDFLTRAGMEDFDIDTFIDNYSPAVSVAFSGGGYRAMLSGAGAFKAIDSRTPGSTESGQVGGLLQSASYVAGLSGGSWLLGSVVLNNFTTIQAIQESDNLWDLEDNILTPHGTLSIIDNTEYYDTLTSEVDEKKEAGYETTLTDYWGRALSRQFLDWKDGGPGVTWSSIALTDEYKNADMPFPIVVADGRYAGETIISKNTTVYEFNPLEFGSFDPSLFAFTPVEYIGSNVTNGEAEKEGICVRGFDNAGFVMGTSSSLFNQIIFQVNSSDLPEPLTTLAESILSGIGSTDDDIADYSPNPFFGVNPDINPTAETKNLTLVDGGEDLQNLPLHPLIQPTRKVDVIFAFDNSADTLNKDGSTSNWPNGTALVATYERAQDSEIANGTLFPSIPDINTIVNLGLNLRPTFFGCDGNNITQGKENAVVPPLVVYIPNSPWSFKSNTSTMTMSYSKSERDNIILNGYNVASQGNGTVEGRENWPACVGCAIIHRQQERQGVQKSQQCQKCFEDYCWNGELKSEVPPEYQPAMILDTSGVMKVVTGMLAYVMAVGTIFVVMG